MTPKPTGRPRVEPAVRFDRMVNFDGPGGCWLWMGRVKPNGYAQFSVGGRSEAAYPLVHRWNYERHVAPIPDGWQVDHLCKVRHCVNPAHLEAVPGAVNNARSDSPSAIKGRQVMCAKSLHELVGDNLHPSYLRRGERVCRHCHAETARLYRERQKQRQAAT